MFTYLGKHQTLYKISHNVSTKKIHIGIQTSCLTIKNLRKYKQRSKIYLEGAGQSKFKSIRGIPKVKNQ